jgi:RNA polymerase sigma-70 factor (ECF subfamily)
MHEFDQDLEQIAERAGNGDSSACQQLLTHYQDRLRRMVAARMDHRLAARLDPSDVVQEALIAAAGKLPGYLQERPIAFYPWLRRLAWEHLVKLHERHLKAQKRSARREEVQPLSHESARLLVNRLVSRGTSPSNRLQRDELRARVRAGLEQLAEADREVLVMRYVEQLSMNEIAAVLGVTEAAVKMRHTRALDRMSRVLGAIS